MSTKDDITEYMLTIAFQNEYDDFIYYCAKLNVHIQLIFEYYPKHQHYDKIYMCTPKAHHLTCKTVPNALVHNNMDFIEYCALLHVCIDEECPDQLINNNIDPQIIIQFDIDYLHKINFMNKTIIDVNERCLKIKKILKINYKKKMSIIIMFQLPKPYV